jgi:transposase
MAEKKVKGRKRHIVTDTMGNLLAVKVHAANIHDTKAGGDVFAEAVCWYPTIKGVCGDAGYRKTFEEYVAAMGLSIEISERITTAWEIIPKRWVVERTLSWLNHSRRLSKDYEITKDSEESFVYISHSATLLKRLSPVS